MWRPVWHVFPICFRLYIWGGILSVPSLQQIINYTSATRLVSSKGKRKKTCQGILVFMICGVWAFEECLEPFDFWVVFLKFQRGWRNSVGQNFQIACGKLCRRIWTLITILSLYIFVKAWETWSHSTARMRGPLILCTEIYKQYYLLWDKMSRPHLESLTKKFEWASRPKSTRTKCFSSSLIVPVFTCTHHVRSLSLSTKGQGRLVETGRWIWKRHLLHTFNLVPGHFCSIRSSLATWRSVFFWIGTGWLIDLAQSSPYLPCIQ